MPAIVERIEISRRPEDDFSYATDFVHFPEWQGASCRRAWRAVPRSALAREPSSHGGSVLGSGPGPRKWPS
jgi:hypothetical protein